MSVITALADAVTRMEGYSPGTRAYRNNNPGNIRGGSIYPQYPLDSGGFTIFPDPATGRAALETDMAAKVNQGLSLRSLVYKYAPPTDGNDSDKYVSNVSTWTGLPADVPLNSIGTSPLDTSGAEPSMSPGGFLSSMLPSFSMTYPGSYSDGDPSYAAPEDNTMLWVGAGILGLVLFAYLSD